MLNATWYYLLRLVLVEVHCQGAGLGDGNAVVCELQVKNQGFSGIPVPFKRDDVAVIRNSADFPISSRTRAAIYPLPVDIIGASSQIVLGEVATSQSQVESAQIKFNRIIARCYCYWRGGGRPSDSESCFCSCRRRSPAIGNQGQCACFVLRLRLLPLRRLANRQRRLTA